jgi:hypothetical protein
VANRGPRQYHAGAIPLQNALESRGLKKSKFAFAADDRHELLAANARKYMMRWRLPGARKAPGQVCRKHMPGATSVSYAVFEPFSKGLVERSS